VGLHERDERALPPVATQGRRIRARRSHRERSPRAVPPPVVSSSVVKVSATTAVASSRLTHSLARDAGGEAQPPGPPRRWQDPRTPRASRRRPTPACPDAARAHRHRPR
jgi:hypothetical protein